MSQRVHLDVDPGCDDAVAIALGLSHPEIDVSGISTVGGNTTVENATANALAVLELFDRTDVPVVRGSGQPLVGSYETAEWVHGEDGIRGDLPEPTTEPVGTHGAEFIVDQAYTYGEDLCLLAVGPMTNLATALVLEPELPAIVDEIYLMGGAALSGGNATPVAEANFRNDPVAAKRVIQSAEPKMVGLEATYEATLPYTLTEEYSGQGKPQETIAAWLEFSEEIREMSAHPGDPALHDAAVLAHVIDDEILSFEPYYLDVDASGGPADGAVLCDERGVTGNEPNASVAVSTDTERFRSLLTETFDQELHNG